jgi:hypothetical protein
LGFAKFSNVPVFITIFSSFVLGLLCALPIAYRLKGLYKGQVKPKKPETHTGHNSSDGGSNETD